MKDKELDAMFRLNGRVALLTGAAGHLGARMAEGLAAAGARVILIDRAGSPLAAVAERIVADGGRAECHEVDLMDEAAIRNGIQRIGDSTGRIDILVNNAYAGRGGTLTAATVPDFENSYRIGVIAPFLLLQAARPWLQKVAASNAGGASVINIGSMYGMVSPDLRVYETDLGSNPPFYGAAKAGLLQMTRYAACQLAPEGIRVNSISPGPFPAPSVQTADPAFVRRLEGKVPLGRVGRPADLVGAVVFLASDAAAYITGVNLPVDGGWTAW